MATEFPEAVASEPPISRNLQGGRFQKGQSGNPAGREPGSRNKATLIREAALTERAVGLLNGLMEKAEAGDMPAARVVLRRVLPSAAPGIDLLPMQSPREIANALGAVAEATASGEITPAQANALTRTLDLQLQALQRADDQEFQERAVRQEATLREMLEQCHRAALEEQRARAAEAAARGEPPPRDRVFNSPLFRWLPTEDWLAATGMDQQLGVVMSPRRGLALTVSRPALRSRGSRH